MSSLVRTALLSVCLVFWLAIVVSGSSIIYEAQCKSVCLGLYEKDFPDDGAPCHYSCKFIKKLYSKDSVQGKCSSDKSYDHGDCTRNRHCGELTKCCYYRCKEIKIDTKGVTSTISAVTSSSLVLEWQKSNVTNAIYILQMRVLHSTTIYYDESEWGTWQQKWQGSDVVPIKFVSIHPGARLQFRVAVVDSTGVRSIGPPSPLIRTLFNASYPSSPEKMWLLSKTYKSNKVDVTLCWLPPRVLDVPVHSYRLFWKEISHITVNGAILETKRTRISGERLNYTIRELHVGKVYSVEIQAVCRWKKERLKSEKLSMNISTEYPKGTNKDEIVVVTNISNVSSKSPNNSSGYGDDDIEEVEVMVEDDEGNSTTDPRPKNNSNRHGSAIRVHIYLWLVLIPWSLCFIVFT